MVTPTHTGLTSLIAGAVFCALASSAAAGPIDTFRSLCMSNLGNPTAIAQAGKVAGFDLIELGAGSFMGSRDSTDESLQINAFTSNKFECAVITSDVADPTAFRDQFFQSIGIPHSGGEARGTVAGQSYTFKHDTNGGEALVVFAN